MVQLTHRVPIRVDFCFGGACAGKTVGFRGC